MEPIFCVQSSAINGLDAFADKELSVGLVEVGVAIDQSSLRSLR